MDIDGPWQKFSEFYYIDNQPLAKNTIFSAFEI